MKKFCSRLLKKFKKPSQKSSFLNLFNRIAKKKIKFMVKIMLFLPCASIFLIWICIVVQYNKCTEYYKYNKNNLKVKKKLINKLNY